MNCNICRNIRSYYGCCSDSRGVEMIGKRKRATEVAASIAQGGL